MNGREQSQQRTILLYATTRLYAAFICVICGCRPCPKPNSYYNDETSRIYDKDLECGDSSPLSLLWRLVVKGGPHAAARGNKLDIPLAFDGDKSPAQSADKSAHSKLCGGDFVAQ